MDELEAEFVALERSVANRDLQRECDHSGAVEVFSFAAGLVRMMCPRCGAYWSVVGPTACEDCAGTGSEYAGGKCLVCNGTGRTPPTNEAGR